jgi:hypothetical protein
VGCNSSGNNAYFIRKDKIGKLKILGIEEGFVESKFRESRDRSGLLSYKSGIERLNIIKGMDVFNIIENKIEKL